MPCSDSSSFVWANWGAIPIALSERVKNEILSILFYIFDYSESRKSTAFLFFVEFMKRHTIHLVYSENNCKEKELLISKNKNTMPAYNFLQFFVQLFTKHNLRKVFLKTTKTMAITTHQLRLHIGSETFTLLLCSIYYCLNIYLF